MLAGSLMALIPQGVASHLEVPSVTKNEALTILREEADFLPTHPVKTSFVQAKRV